jgi:hypothetical protein
MDKGQNYDMIWISKNLDKYRLTQGMLLACPIPFTKISLCFSVKICFFTPKPKPKSKTKPKPKPKPNVQLKIPVIFLAM